MKSKAIAFVAIALAVAPVFARDGKGVAERLFADYQKRARAFDSASADLYCDSATIRNVRIHPDGQRRTLELSAPKYKDLIRAAMPLARARGDTNTYSDIRYSKEGSGIRITATRYSELKRYSSPISLLVGACNGGDWAILEELSESRP